MELLTMAGIKLGPALGSAWNGLVFAPPVIGRNRAPRALRATRAEFSDSIQVWKKNYGNMLRLSRQGSRICENTLRIHLESSLSAV